MAELVTIVSKRSQPVDWRPHAHHNLYKLDSHFDSRFNAVLRCESYLKALYQTIVETHHAPLMDRLVEDIRRSACLGAGPGSGHRKTSMSCVTTSLMDPDRETVLDACLLELEARVPFLVCDSPCLAGGCAHELLCEMAEAVRRRIERRAEMDRRRAVRGPANLVGKDMPARIADAPLHAMASLLVDSFPSSSSSSSSAAASAPPGGWPASPGPAVVMLLRHAERIDLEVFSALVEALAGFGDLRVHLVLFTSALCPLPLRLDKSAQSLVDASVHSGARPWAIYDDFMGRVFASRLINVSLPPALIAWIHESFWRSHCSVKDAMDKIMLSLAHHFSARRSLLCMYEETQWLTEMKLCKKTGKTDDEQHSHAILQILSFMGAEDMVGTGIRLALREEEVLHKTTSWRHSEVMSAKTVLRRSMDRAHLDKLWFQCLVMMRDKFLIDENQRVDYCSDILWAAVRDGGKSGCSLIPDLLDVIQNHALRVPTNVLRGVVEELVHNLNDFSNKLPAIFAEELDDDDCEVDMGTPLRRARQKACLDADQLMGELIDHQAMFYEILDILNDKGIHPSTLPAQLPKKIPSPNKRLRLRLSPTHQLASPAFGAANASPHAAQGSTPFLAAAAAADLTKSLFSGASSPSPSRRRRQIAVTSPSSPAAAAAAAAAPLLAAASPVAPPTRKSPMSTRTRASSSSLAAAAPHSLRETFHSPVRARCDPLLAAPPSSGSGGGSRLKALLTRSPGAVELVFESSIFRFVEIAVEDVVATVRALADLFQSLPRPPPITGILDISDAAAKATLACSSSSIRSVYLDGLLGPPERFHSDPDVSVLAEIVSRADRRALNLFDLFDEFVENSEDWQELLRKREDKKKRKKKRKAAQAEDEENEEREKEEGGGEEGEDGEVVVDAKGKRKKISVKDEVQYRCRFVRSLNDLEKVGMIKICPSGNEADRLTFVFMST